MSPRFLLVLVFLRLAVGFGAQTLLKDVINVMFILVEDSLVIGDVVNFRETGA